MAEEIITKEYILDLSQKTVDYALTKDITSAEVFSSYNDIFQIMTEGRSIANEREKSELGFAIRVLKGETQGFAYTNKADLESLKSAVNDAIGVANVAPPNPGARLPSKAEYSKVEGVYTNSVRDLSVDFMIDTAKEILAPMGEVSVDIRTNLSSVTKEEEWTSIVNSQGIEAFQKANYFYGGFFVVPREGDKVGAFVFDNYFTHDPSSIDYRKFGEELTQRAVRNMDATTPAAIESDIVVFKEEAVFNPIGIVAAQAISARNVLQNRSMWRDKLADTVAIDGLNVIDDSHNPDSGAGSKSFDAEGTPTQTTTIIKDGVLENFLFDELRASKMNAESTGNSIRSVFGQAFMQPPSQIFPNSLSIKPGDHSFEELIEDIKLGIIYEYFSGSFRVENGIFSGVAKGAQLIRNGELAEPLINVSIGGNVFDVLMNIEGMTKEAGLSNFILKTPKIRAKGINISTQK
jgi:PmbA protein